MLLGYSDAELSSMGGYDMVHFDDLAYVASAHQERESRCNKISFLSIKIRNIIHTELTNVN